MVSQDSLRLHGQACHGGEQPERNSPSAPAMIPLTLDSSAPRAVLLLESGCKHLKLQKIETHNIITGTILRSLDFFKAARSSKPLSYMAQQGQRQRLPKEQKKGLTRGIITSEIIKSGISF